MAPTHFELPGGQQWTQPNGPIQYTGWHVQVPCDIPYACGIPYAGFQPPIEISLADKITGTEGVPVPERALDSIELDGLAWKVV